MPLTDHPLGDYRFLPGIAPYSCGVISIPGFEIAQVTLHGTVSFLQGFEATERHLTSEEPSRAALCEIELRSPCPFDFEGFAEFNAGYARILKGWGLFVEGLNPVAHTNVDLEVDPPGGPALYGFSNSRPCDPSLPPTFVIAGSGELPDGILATQAIVRACDPPRTPSPPRLRSWWTSWSAGYIGSAATGPTSPPSTSTRSTLWGVCCPRSSSDGPGRR